MPPVVRALAGLTFLAAAPACGAPPVDTKPVHVCRFPAYLTDKDPAGTNIRAAPSPTAPVIGQLPPLQGDFGAEFRISGGTGAWFLMHDAAWGNYPDDIKIITCGGGLAIFEEHDGKLVAPGCLESYRRTGNPDCAE